MPDKSASTRGRVDMKSSGGIYDQAGNLLLEPDGDMVLTGDVTLGDASTDTLTIGATSQFNAPITVGVDDTGYDVKFFGATASAYMLWDESADDLILAGAAGLSVAGTSALVVTNITGNTAFGVDGTGVDVTFFGDTASAQVLWDQSDDALEVIGDARLDFSGATIKAANTDGGLIRGGTSGAKITEDTADMKFISFYTDCGATSGDSRGIYFRHELTGAGGGGESLRSFTKISAACSTARGAHISLDLAATGTLSGFGAAVDAQVLIGDASITSNVNCLNTELYAAGSSTAIAARSASLLRFVVGGDATGVADIVGKASFFRFENAAASGGFVDSDITSLTGKAGLRVTDNTGALYGYIPIVTGS